MNILDFFLNIWMICFILKFFMEPYRFYGYSGASSMIDWCTEPLCRRIRRIIAFKTDSGNDLTPFLAIALIVIARGVIYWSAGVTILNSTFPLPIGAIQLSIIQFVNLITKVLFICFILSVLLSKYGVTLRSIVLINVINDISFAVFRGLRKIFKTENLNILIFGAIGGLIIIYTLIFMLVMVDLNFFNGLISGLGMCIQTLSFFSFVIILYALMSWVSPDPHNPVVQLINAIAEPFIMLTRRIFPWGNLGMIDFTPVITFLFIWILQAVLFSIIGNIFALIHPPITALPMGTPIP